MLRLLLCIAVALVIPCSAIGSMQVNAPHAENGVSCEDCHGTAAPEQKAKSKVCLNCHDAIPGTSKEYLDNGSPRSVNIHNSHDGQLRCTLCHQIHAEPKFYCNNCHKFDVKVP